MSITLQNAALNAAFAFSQISSNGLDSAIESPIVNVGQQFGIGTGSNNANAVWASQRTLATATSEVLDLTALPKATLGSGAFSKVKLLIIDMVAQNTGYTLQIGNAGTNAWSPDMDAATDVLTIGAGGTLIKVMPVDGWTVDSTHKLLKINNPAGGSITYNIIVVGEGTIS